MKIQEERAVTLVEVEVGDDYRVEVRQAEPVVTYTPEQACELGRQLWRAGLDARRMQREDAGDLEFVAPVAITGEQVL